MSYVTSMIMMMTKFLISKAHPKVGEVLEGTDKFSPNMCPVYGAARENHNGAVGAMGMRPTDMKIFYLREKIRPIWEGLYTRSPVDINNEISGGYWLPPTVFF